MGDPVGKTMRDKIKDSSFLGIRTGGGFKIFCVDAPNTAGNGRDCGSSALGDNKFSLSNLSSARCGSLAKTIRHELQHGPGNTRHVRKADGSLDCAKDHVYACDQACYGQNNCGAIDAATAKANCK